MVFLPRVSAAGRGEEQGWQHREKVLLLALKSSLFFFPQGVAPASRCARQLWCLHANPGAAGAWSETSLWGRDSLLGKPGPATGRCREFLISGGQAPNHKSHNRDEKWNFGALVLINFLFREMQFHPFKIKLIF